MKITGTEAKTKSSNITYYSQHARSTFTHTIVLSIGQQNSIKYNNKFVVKPNNYEKRLTKDINANMADELKIRCLSNFCKS